jgi:two-component system phosphate regulon sensor histidine kinase PhoR
MFRGQTRTQGIRWKIGAPYVLLILILMAGLGIYISNFLRQTYLSDLERRLFDQALLAGDALAPQMAAGAGMDTLDPLAKRWAALLKARVTLVGPDGVVLGESQEDPRQMENHGNRPEILDARAHGLGSATRFSDTVGYDMLYVASAVKSNGELVGFARIALPLKQVQANIAALQRSLLAATVLATLAALLLAVWIANRTTRPLCDLIQAARQIAAGHLETHLIPSSQDEIGQLTHTFNEMAEQLGLQMAALEAEHSRVAAVLGVMTDGVIIVDGEDRVQLINPAAEGMFEVEAKDALGHTLIEVVRHHQVDELLQHCREQGEVQVSILEIALRKLYLQTTATPLGQALPGNTLLLFQNLTRLRRLETVRQDFISNISHELRTPLASLKALTETLQESALDDPPAAHRFLLRMETEVDALSQMVEELLELTRIESGRVPLKMTPTSPLQLISQAVERLNLQAQRGGLQVTIDCPPDLPPVLVDARRLEQVIVNLLHNAIKFTPQGGQITLSAQHQPERILFMVADTGVGIPADDLPRIFERFFKTDRARSGGGTGLGLAIARHLVEAHGGGIWAESIEGKGSAFYFSIPIAV